jgi:2-polyprenyl-6-methoxyphenol hydroxylase-like FAD-dependent oxidoreductase
MAAVRLSMAAVASESSHRVAVVGASLGGLAAANVLSQLGFTVHVFERSHTTFEAKGHGLGYVDVGLWEELRGVQMIRRGKQASRAQGAFYYGDLWRFLYEGLPRGTVRLSHTIQSLGNNTARPCVNGEVYDMAVIADGGWSGLRHHFTKKAPSYSGYVVWRGNVDAIHVPGFEAFGVFKEGHLDTIALPLTTDDGRTSIMIGFFLATPEAEIVRPETGTGRHTTEPGHNSDAASHRRCVPEWLLPLYRKKFAGHAGGELVRLMEAVIEHGKMAPHPQFEFGTDAVTAGRCVMVGDAAHMASPRTAVGAHTAILDAMALRAAFSESIARGREDVIDTALAMYNAGGLQRAQELHYRSLQVGQQFLPRQGAAVSPSLLLGREELR